MLLLLFLLVFDFHFFLLEDSAAVQISIRGGLADPALDGNVQGEDHRRQTKDAQTDISNLGLHGLGADLVVEHGREDEAQRHTGSRADKRDKLVQRGSADTKRNKGANDDQSGTQHVLGHLDLQRLRARPIAKDALLENLGGRRQHERDRKNHGKRVQNLNGDGPARGDGQVQNDNGLGVAAKCQVTKGTNAHKNQSDNSNGDGQHAGELFRLGHRLGNWNDYDRVRE